MSLMIRGLGGPNLVTAGLGTSVLTVVKRWVMRIVLAATLTTRITRKARL